MQWAVFLNRICLFTSKFTTKVSLINWKGLHHKDPLFPKEESRISLKVYETAIKFNSEGVELLLSAIKELRN